MPRLIIIALVLGAAFYFIFRVMNEFFGGISGTRSALKDDFKELDQLVDKFQLTPWRTEELDLLSRQHDVKSETLMYSHQEYGQFYSIYEEPIMAFATKEYLNNDRRLASIKINNDKYHFNVFEGIVSISKRGSVIGHVSLENGIEVEMNGKKLHIDSLSSSGLIPLSINDNHKMSIATADEHTGTAGRMLHKMEDLDQNESDLVLVSIAFALADKQI